ncbi:DUF6377 domain-containing protein [uncultured Alistipes sp.]|uniref:DUF6377 domain-containing protein n=1 Tax=uncultured Alistipes sp. TaxID=538949 RepID=UPI00261DB7C6|nr:DUF6377 domain-containing protein [uncultured Alistipes sp.]
MTIRHAITTLCVLLSLFCRPLPAGAAASSRMDSLRRVLNETIAGADRYTEQKNRTIDDLRRRAAAAADAEERYAVQSEIVANYESFICDSAEHYVLRNIRVARQFGNEDCLTDSRLKLAFLYSLSGLFLQADSLFRTIDYPRLQTYQKCQYHWNRIRYYENLIHYSNDERFTSGYERQIDRCRDSLLSLLSPGSKEWLTEKAFLAQRAGDSATAVAIFDDIFRRQEPDTHAYAMSAMCLAKAYQQAGDAERQEYYLMVAATTDIRLAVKENEALLALATLLFETGDIDRAYSYISFALSDANFYNSRFKNTMIARLYPIIESCYLDKLDTQRRNLRIFGIVSSLLALGCGIALFFYFRQTRIVSQARSRLKKLTEELLSLNKSLDEANLVKERYLGYFMNQCSIYVNKLDRLRRDVSLKIRNKQYDRLQELAPARGREEEEALCTNFDQAFLELYPDFVEKFNQLLAPQSRYVLEEGHLNTELRIFALIRLGISDVPQIANFLHCSPQTIYNYKSKIKKAALEGGENFEQTVRTLGKLSFNPSHSDLPNEM